MNSREWAVLLNGRAMRTVYKDALRLPTKSFAVAVAAEW